MEKKRNSIEQLDLDLFIWFSFVGVHFPIEIKDAIERVKLMRKEELEHAYFVGSCDRMNDEGSFEQYYNETYGGQNEN